MCGKKFSEVFANFGKIVKKYDPDGNTPHEKQAYIRQCKKRLKPKTMWGVIQDLRRTLPTDIQAQVEFGGLIHARFHRLFELIVATKIVRECYISKEEDYSEGVSDEWIQYIGTSFQYQTLENDFPDYYSAGLNKNEKTIYQKYVEIEKNPEKIKRRYFKCMTDIDSHIEDVCIQMIYEFHDSEPVVFACNQCGLNIIKEVI